MGEIRGGDRRATTEEVTLRAAKAASGFASLGVGFGDTVAIFLRNDIAFLEVMGGAGLVGAYPVPANWHYTPDEAALSVRELRRQGHRDPCRFRSKRCGPRSAAGVAGAGGAARRPEIARLRVPMRLCRRRSPPA